MYAHCKVNDSTCKADSKLKFILELRQKQNAQWGRLNFCEKSPEFKLLKLLGSLKI